MKEKIEHVMVFQDNIDEWWLEFFVDGVRHQVTIQDVIDGLAGFINMQDNNVVRLHRVDNFECTCLYELGGDDMSLDVNCPTHNTPI